MFNYLFVNDWGPTTKTVYLASSLIIIVRLEFSPQDRTLPNILSTVP